METKHTPGPWKYSYLTNYVFSLDENGQDDKGICEVNESGTKTKEEIAANAKLIAAAPELLAALNALMDEYNSEGQLLGFNVNIAREAIKKATD